MAKARQRPAVEFVCYQPTAQDYVMIPLLHLHPSYVVGVNCTAPVYFPDGPGARRDTEYRVRREERKRREDAGEEIPTPVNLPDRSFAIDEKGRFTFGYWHVIVVKERELQPGEIRVRHLYDAYGEIHPEDEIDVELRGGISPQKVSVFPLGVKLD